MTHEHRDSVSFNFDPSAPDQGNALVVSDSLERRAWQDYQAFMREYGENKKPSIIYHPLASAPMPHLDELREASETPEDFRDQLQTVQQLRGGAEMLPLISASPHMDMVSELMLRAYPETMEYCADFGTIKDVLSQSEADYFSFLALDEDQHSEPMYAACCLAFLAPSADPNSHEEVLHVNDIVALPDSKRTLLGIRIFREVVARAKYRGIRTIELIAREKTSLRAFAKRPAMRRMFEVGGYTVENSGVAKTVGDGDDKEVFYGICLRQIED